MSEQRTLYREGELWRVGADLHLTGYLQQIIREAVPVEPTDRIVWCFAHNVNVSKVSMNPDEYDVQCGAGLIFGTPCDIGVGGLVRVPNEDSK